MRFIEFIQIKEAREALAELGVDHRDYDVRAVVESGLASQIKKGISGGVLALAPFLIGGDAPAADKPQPAKVIRMKRPDFGGERYKKMIEASKDDGRYYDSSTEKKLRARAEDGDEWAVRELPWPKGHPLHRLGRPFFRNHGPHPDGLFPSSGL